MSTLAPRNFPGGIGVFFSMVNPFLGFIAHLLLIIIAPLFRKSATTSDISIDILNANLYFNIPGRSRPLARRKKTNPIRDYSYAGIPDIA